LIDAPLLQNATLGGAGIAVVAVKTRSGDTFATITLVTSGTCVIVGARQLVDGVNTAKERGTAIGGARIVVVTVQVTSEDATSLVANVPFCAFVPVAAGLSVKSLMDTAKECIACIISALIAVIASQNVWSRYALTLAASVADGADIVVGARSCRGRRLTAHFRVTSIQGTRIIVVTNGHYAPGTRSIFTLLANCTGVPVSAREAIISGHNLAIPTLGIALRRLTDGIGTVRQLALHHRFRNNLTLKRHR